MSAAEWFPVNPGKYLKNTMHLTTRQHGAYWLLILAAFEGKGALPGTDTGLASIAKLTPKEWKEDGDTLKAFLARQGDRWIHEYVMFEWNETQARIEAKREAGRVGAQRRWGGKGNGTPIADPSFRHCQTDAQLQEQEHVTTTNRIERGGAHAPRANEGADDGRRGTRLSEDWKPTPVERDFAADLGLDPESTASTFRDYWCAVAGAKGRKADWPATWRNWCRRDADNRRAPARGGAGFRSPARGSESGAFAQAAALLAGGERVRG